MPHLSDERLEYLLSGRVEGDRDHVGSAARREYSQLSRPLPRAAKRETRIRLYYGRLSRTRIQTGGCVSVCDNSFKKRLDSGTRGPNRGAEIRQISRT